jgi:uncharacterized protein DUF4258
MLPVDRMTRTDADRIIARIKADEIQLHQSDHARRQLRSRLFSPHDVRAVLQCHEMEAAPEWSEDHQNHKVCLAGKCLEGRPTRLVLGLREEGPCVLVTIMEVRDKPKTRRHE